MPFSDTFTFRAFNDPGPSWTPQRSQPTNYSTGGGYSGGGFTAGNLYGAAPQAGAGAYGGVPQVPSPTTTMRNAISGNATNLQDLFNMAQRLNAHSQQQLTQQYQTALPGFSGAMQTSMDNIQSNLQGQIDPSVMRQIQQDAAERGVTGGTVGSGNIDSNYLTNVLRNRLALQQQGQTNLTNRIASAPVAKPFDTGNFLISPTDMFNAQMGANIYAAAPNPAAAAAAARANFNQGLQYGAGAGGGIGGIARGAPTSPFLSTNWGGGGGESPIVGNSLSNEMIYGGQEFGPGGPSNYSNLVNNWNQLYGGAAGADSNDVSSIINEMYPGMYS